MLRFDFTAVNTQLSAGLFNNTDRFSLYINDMLAGATYGMGGYDELRTVYARSAVFDHPVEPRRLHLGHDIWGRAGTPVHAPLEGQVHSFAFNNQFGDYGATIILKHQIAGCTFHTLYGHLSLADIQQLREGQTINRGQEFAHFGIAEENGHWPPHLHFQVIEHMDGYMGDYPGVCRLSERAMYLANCPDPDLILGMFQYAVAP